MANATTGMISAADMILTMDGLAKWFKQIVSPMGQGLDSESGVPTFAWLIKNALNKELGDGSTVYGLQNSALQARLEPSLEQAFSGNRYEGFAAQMRSILGDISSFLINDGRIPKYLVTSGNSQTYNAWKLSTSSIASGSGNQALDGWLQYLNATWIYGSIYSTAPTNAPSLAATTGGQRPAVASGAASRLAYAWVYDSDFHCSQISPWSSQVAIAGSNSAYNATAWDAVPTGATKIRIFMESSANANTGVGSWLKDLPVSFGTGVGTVKITEWDQNLRDDVPPPSWICCPVMPEFAHLMALAFASVPDIRTALYIIAANGMLDPCNVGCGPVNGILGYTNQASSATFGSAAATAWTAGAIQTANSYTQGLQGFVGATNGVQLRTTSILNANATISNVGYHYRSAANPGGTTGTVAGPLTLNAAVGSTLDLAIPAGRIVTSIDSMTIAGIASGAFLAEAKVIRSL